MKHFPALSPQHTSVKSRRGWPLECGLVLHFEPSVSERKLNQCLEMLQQPNFRFFKTFLSKEGNVNVNVIVLNDVSVPTADARWVYKLNSMAKQMLLFFFQTKVTYRFLCGDPNKQIQINIVPDTKFNIRGLQMKKDDYKVRSVYHGFWSWRLLRLRT